MKDSVGLIGEGIEVTGQINFEGTLRIEGSVKGTISSVNGTVSVGQGGVVEADVKTNTCVVDGVLTGDLIATTRVEISRNGRVTGKVMTKDLVIVQGGIFEGNLDMTKHPSNSSVIPLQEIKKEADDSNAA